MGILKDVWFFPLASWHKLLRILCYKGKKNPSRVKPWSGLGAVLQWGKFHQNKIRANFKADNKDHHFHVKDAEIVTVTKKGELTVLNCLLFECHLYIWGLSVFSTVLFLHTKVLLLAGIIFKTWRMQYWVEFRHYHARCVFQMWYIIPMLVSHNSWLRECTLFWERSVAGVRCWEPSQNCSGEMRCAVLYLLSMLVAWWEPPPWAPLLSPGSF